MPAEQPVLSVSGLQKRVRGRTIVNDVSFQVRRGEIFGFLGPNGAGKTTTIRMLVGLIRPSAGEIYINGVDLRKYGQSALRQVGCIVENPDMYPYLTGRENLLQLARMQGPAAVERIDEVARLVHLDARLDEKVGTYSLGMRQRLGIAQALLGKPKLLILDEPTNGLDPAGIRELRTFLRALAKDGLSIFISSHLLAEIELLCDHVAIIRDGTVVQTGDVASLLAAATTDVLWRVAPADIAQPILARHGLLHSTGRVPQGSDRLPGAERAGLSAATQPAADTPTTVAAPTSIRCTMQDDAVAACASELAAAGCRVFEITRLKATLEDVFLRTTGGSES